MHRQSQIFLIDYGTRARKLSRWRFYFSSFLLVTILGVFFIGEGFKSLFVSMFYSWDHDMTKPLKSKAVLIPSHGIYDFESPKS